MAKVIAISNQKGGVGKTTTSINLSTCLALLGKKVLLVDLDPQGNATKGIGINREEMEYAIEDIIVEGVDTKKVIIQSKYENLSIIPSTINLAAADLELMKELSRENRLKSALEGVKDEFDYVIIDCPPSLGLLTVNAFTAADSVLITLQCEFYALEGISLLFNTIKLIQKKLNSSLEIEGVLLTMFDTRTNLSHEVAEEAKKFFGDQLYNVVISKNVKLAEAPSHGESITEYDPNSRGAKQYMELAHEVLSNA